MIYEWLRTQWLLLGMGIGSAMLTYAVLTYLLIWRPRKTDADGEEPQPRAMLKAIPWAFWVTVIGLTVFAVLVFIAKIENPPNW